MKTFMFAIESKKYNLQAQPIYYLLSSAIKVTPLVYVKSMLYSPVEVQKKAMKHGVGQINVAAMLV